MGEGEGDGDEHERLVDRFSLLREILEQITQESGIALVALEVKPLPPVPRCSYHMIDHEKSRCYLLARFKLRNGEQRYLLEIDTSDNRKTMSTRIMGFKAEEPSRKQDCPEPFEHEAFSDPGCEKFAKPARAPGPILFGRDAQERPNSQSRHHPD